MTENTCLTDGSPVTPDHKQIDPATGMQKGYVVLCPEERAKGYVRPYRDAYVHIGARPQYSTRELTEDEKKQYASEGFVAYEKYPEERLPLTGRFWTEKQLHSGCGSETKMNSTIAETYARNPKFYGATFCVNCGKHFPLNEFVWAGTDEVVGS